MKSKEEREYYAYLERVIRERKGLSPFFGAGTEDFDMDIGALAEHVARKNPRLAARLVGNFVDASEMENASKQDILRFMARTEKGTVVKWRGETGETVYLVNNGERFFSRSKQITVVGERLTKGDLLLLRKTMYGTVLKRDIKKVYQKIAREEERKRKPRSFGESVLAIFNQRPEAAGKIKASSKFERRFKELCVEFGGGASPYATAKVLFAGMSEGEKKSLAKSLKLQGVSSERSLLGLLEKWKAEALNPKLAEERTLKRAVRRRSVEVLHSR